MREFFFMPYSTFSTSSFSNSLAVDQSFSVPQSSSCNYLFQFVTISLSILSCPISLSLSLSLSLLILSCPISLSLSLSLSLLILSCPISLTLSLSLSLSLSPSLPLSLSLILPPTQLTRADDVNYFKCKPQRSISGDTVNCVFCVCCCCRKDWTDGRDRMS